jgi:hypothetical protein
MSEALLARLAAVQKMKTPELTALWKQLYDSKPPPYNRLFLVSRLSYRIQELEYGGLKPATVMRLEALGDSLDGGSVKKRRVRADRRPITGTQLIRDWRGVRHTVTVRLDDFEWQGGSYKHLTPIAKAITGKQWNGWVFFGLKSQG